MESRTNVGHIFSDYKSCTLLHKEKVFRKYMQKRTWTQLEEITSCLYVAVIFVSLIFIIFYVYLL